MEKCKYCGNTPRTVEICGIFYTQCTGCSHYDPYRFMGITKDGSLKQWNAENIRRIGNQEAREVL